MGLSFNGHHGGQILFGPTDGYMYFMMGDGGGTADPYNFSQNKKSLLGKITRLDVDNIPSEHHIHCLVVLILSAANFLVFFVKQGGLLSLCS